MGVALASIPQGNREQEFVMTPGKHLLNALKGQRNEKERAGNKK